MDLTTNLYVLLSRPDLFKHGDLKVIHDFGDYQVVEFDERPLLGFRRFTLFLPYVGGELVLGGPSGSMALAVERASLMLRLP